ncbi:aminotransferase class I/II-fold pyridoxal phosphate-dependent enzyme [Bacillus sp. PK3_68]|uniref:aminotransferase class I/II-fold pyridoxal phosphate-dependent enzyme n=1 Tax=Bacillus sp. PK3_68 TaxID=2027408 RepID=UPI000E751704|nr:aminotransferase class I/II-fold pyridoxal phosphate-dependent enzyme [Bacillus sp. PK3_68]RJS62398.1 hypothetical protein CJ483_22080 [Bacillus sp. PK3_68]
MLNPLALELNNKIEDNDAYIYQMLSSLGRSLYFPKGIVSQSTEALQKAHKFNATIGVATKKESPMYLNALQSKLSAFDPKDLYPYAPPTGKMELRKIWKEKLINENPSLSDKNFGIPIVTNGLTHGLSIVADLFVEKGDPIILPDMYWDNYNLTFDFRHGSQTVIYPLFSSTDKFYVEAMEEAMLLCGKSKIILMLNFPNNPTGYTPYEEEVRGIIETIIRIANSGVNIIVVADDAYFGQFYEDSIKESIFSRLIGIHPRVLPIKVDGATKEEYAWGFRVGFLTFGIQNKEVLEALEEKTLASIRSTISCCSHPSQTFILDVLQHPDFKAQRKSNFQIMKSRWQRIKEILSSSDYTDAFEPYPFNSGYFICLRIKQVDAELLREYLVNHYGVGTISFGHNNLRLAFSSVELEDLDKLFVCIYQACKELEKKTVKL